MGVRSPGGKARRVGRMLLHLLYNLLLGLTLAVLVYLVFTLFFRTDTERRLRREIRMYERLYPELERRERLLGDAIAHLRLRDDEIYGLIFNAGAPGVNPMEDPLTLSAIDTIPDYRLVGYVRDKADSLLSRSRDVEAAFGRIFRALSDTAAVLPPMTLPAEPVTFPQVGAGTGRKVNPFYGAYVHHAGLDLLLPRGTPVHAAAAGIVVRASFDRTGGYTVRICHEGGYETVYSHLEGLTVRAGQPVRVGGRIGSVGMSGQAFAPHLHYEVRKDGTEVDPMSCLFASVSPEEYANMLYMSVNTKKSMD